MLVLVSTGLALCALALAAWLITSRKFSLFSFSSSRAEKKWRNAGASSPVFLFENSRLTQANASALRLLGKTKSRDISWPDVRTVLADLVPQIPVSLKALEDGSRVFPEQREPLAHSLSVEHKAPFTRVELQIGDWVNPIAPGQECLEAPFPIWAEDETGETLWKNRAFNKTKLTLHLTGMERARRPKADRRISIPARKGSPAKHFKVLTKKMDNCTVHYALNAEDAVAAEESRQDVVQTLGKTFAQLATGLVVFDRDGNLVLFNPAVIDLFGFSAGFLSAHPSLESFFDHMRDNRMIPEPKNYLDWRERIKDRVTGASGAQFRENWQLPNGATIRATSMPNPDGGVGFLFEDISAQVSSTRRFRDELALSHTLLDSLEDAIAAIDVLGRVVFTNQAFQTYWKVDPESSFADFTESDLINALKREISPQYIRQISTFLTQREAAPSGTLLCTTSSGVTLELQMTRARGQLVVLRHAIPEPTATKEQRILTS